jgi:hypothetical protein
MSEIVLEIRKASSTELKVYRKLARTNKQKYSLYPSVSLCLSVCLSVSFFLFARRH